MMSSGKKIDKKKSSKNKVDFLLGVHACLTLPAECTPHEDKLS